MTRCTFLLCLLTLALCSSAAYADSKPAPAVNADAKESFATVNEWVHKEMSKGGRYEHVTDKERVRIDARLNEMGALLDKHGSVAQMGDADKTKMFNAQEEVNALLAGRDGDRLICQNVAPVGSHIPVKKCNTAREIENSRLAAGRALSDKQMRAQQSGGN